MIIINPASPMSSGLAIGLPVNSSHIPKNIGNMIINAFVVASVLFFIKSLGHGLTFLDRWHSTDHDQGP